MTPDLRTLSDLELDDARRQIGEVKLSIRRRTDLRPILFAMELMGEEWWWEGDELRVKPAWKPPVNIAHRELIAMTRRLNVNLEEINRETDRRQRVPRSTKPAATR